MLFSCFKQAKKGGLNYGKINLQSIITRKTNGNIQRMADRESS